MALPPRNLTGYNGIVAYTRSDLPALANKPANRRQMLKEHRVMKCRDQRRQPQSSCAMRTVSYGPATKRGKHVSQPAQQGKQTTGAKHG